MHDLYPHGPQQVPADLTQPNAAYKQRAWLAVLSLALFVVLYLALTGWFVWTTYRLFQEANAGGPGAWINYFVGGCAAFLSIFMLKALVFIKRGGDPDAVEVFPHDQPKLFEFLYRLADEAGAPRPKRVFLSARVNAAVFYDLSIFNLLFPSQKNLEIGLALVNVLTLSEMKAVLAHEFGHFAQRSMAIGSWVYIAQQIALHVIAKRDALDKFLRGLSNFDIRFAWIGWILSLIVWSIRSLMDTLLRLVVLAQRALSRQMEFQADLVAVSLTGSDELVHALHKLHSADEAWNRTVGFVGSELRRGHIPHDLFEVQSRIIEKVAKILNDENYGKVPEIHAQSPELRRIFKTSFAQPPQMWSTHPANTDREQNAKRQYLSAPHDARSAWLLFDQVATIKQAVNAFLIGQTEAQPATAEQTFASLDEHYERIQYRTIYRGAYLARDITRHTQQASDLYHTLSSDNLLQALDALYPEQLAEQLSKLRELSEEHSLLQAVRDKVFQPTGGRIMHRGREISRRELPATIVAVDQEKALVQQQIVQHDRLCRSTYLAVAAQVGGNWQTYLKGLIQILHYAEHTLADIRDAQGALGNVVAIVTADGKVTKKELKRLIVSANMLHAVLVKFYAQQHEVKLDEKLCERLNVQTWANMLEEFTLPAATPENIGDWMNVIDGWCHAASNALGALCNATLEQLLFTEDEMADCLRNQNSPSEAPLPSCVPAAYATLIVGQERERQKKLDLWSRFQTADGSVATGARLLVASAVVVTVLSFGGETGTVSTISIYNGLGITTFVRVDKSRVAVPPYSTLQIEQSLDEKTVIETSDQTGKLIEIFNPNITGHSLHYVYNVANAAALVEWPAIYGAVDTPPATRMLGAPRWISSDVDVFFEEPPKNVQTKGKGAVKMILTGVGNASPVEIFNLVSDAKERDLLVQAHKTWDKPDAQHYAEWQAMR